MWRILAAIILSLGIAACDKADAQREALEAADRRVKVGAYREAIRSYESVLDGTAKTADIHYKIAVLYDDKLKEPLDAIHHYERYLDFASGKYGEERIRLSTIKQALMSDLLSGRVRVPA